MSNFSENIKSQVENLDRTFSNTLLNAKNVNYKYNFIKCRTTNNKNQCNLMESQLNTIHENLNTLKAIDTLVEAKVNDNKQNVEGKKTTFDDKKKAYLSGLKKSNIINDFDQASDPLRKDKEKNMVSKYLYLAYYIFADILIIYFLHKQYKFPVTYLLAVFIVILVIIFILKYFFDIPCVGVGCFS